MVLISLILLHFCRSGMFTVQLGKNTRSYHQVILYIVQGGLGIPQLKEQASIQFLASLKHTSAHRESKKDQDTCVREKKKRKE